MPRVGTLKEGTVDGTRVSNVVIIVVGLSVERTTVGTVLGLKDNVLLGEIVGAMLTDIGSGVSTLLLGEAELDTDIVGVDNVLGAFDNDVLGDDALGFDVGMLVGKVPTGK